MTLGFSSKHFILPFSFSVHNHNDLQSCQKLFLFLPLFWSITWWRLSKISYFSFNKGDFPLLNPKSYILYILTWNPQYRKLSSPLWGLWVFIYFILNFSSFDHPCPITFLEKHVTTFFLHFLHCVTSLQNCLIFSKFAKKEISGVLQREQFSKVSV